MDRFQQYIEEYRQNIKEDVSKRLQFIKDQVFRSGLKGVVVGISGGLDSAVTAALCVRSLGSDNVIGVWMPAYSLEVHANDSAKLAEATELHLVTIDLSATYDQMVAAINTSFPMSDKTKGNTKARLRMTTLYAIANQRSYLVAGTDNASEVYVGYSTKGGDALSDFNPVAGLTKTQIRILAEHLGIPQSIINKPPSADLWEGQTDEQEMGFSYEQLDRYIITGDTNQAAKERINYLHRISEHKRKLTPEM